MFLIISALFSLSTMSYGVEGQFSYKGDFQVHSAVRHETVSPLSTAGQNRLQELKNQGYSCQAKLQFVQCRKNIATQELPNSLLSATPSALQVEFGTLISMDLISQGDDIAFFEGTQTVNVDGKIYETAQYLERPDLIKATVGNPHDTDNYYSFVVNAHDVSMVETLTATESKWVYTTYFVEFILTR